MIDDYISTIEDLIATYSKSPAKLQMELKKFLDSYEGVILDDPPFGDERLAQIVKDVKNGKPLDSAYIQAIDFSEGNYKDQEEAHENVSKKIDDALNKSSINFKGLLIDPMFITDWPVHKHEMVGHFVTPQVPADEMVKMGRMDEMCDPVTISLIEKMQEELPSVPAGLNYGELEKYFYEHPSEFMNVMDEIRGVQGPTMEEYLDLAGTTVLEPAIVAGLVNHPEQLPPKMQAQVLDVLGPEYAVRQVISEDFAETDRGRAWKGIRTARKISTKAKDYTDDQIQEARKLLRELKGVENSDVDRYPAGTEITFNQFSESLLQTGEIEGKERFLSPELKEKYDQMKSDGVLSPVKIDLDHPLSYDDGLVIIMIERTPENRFKKLDDIKGRLTTPGDFMRLYDKIHDFAVDQTAAINLASSLSGNEVSSFLDDRKRNSDKMEIPQGMDPTKNQNHKIRG